MTIDITMLLERAKLKKDEWSEKQAESLANLISSKIDGIVDWDGSSTEDWIVVKFRRNDPRREDIHFTLFLYIYMPLGIISRDAMSIIPNDMFDFIELIVFDDYTDPIFKLKKA